MSLRNNHVVGDSRQEHVDNHNIIEPAVSQLSALRYPAFTPASLGQVYNGNGYACSANRTTGSILDQLIAGTPLFSGAAGITIDRFDAHIATLGSAGAVYRMGVWTVDDQTNPFKMVVATKYGTLLKDAGTVDATSIGAKLLTPAQVTVIPANVWFVVGGVPQIAISQPTIGNGASAFSPMGQSNALTGVSSTLAWLVQTGVSGNLGDLVPTGLINIGHACGFRRSV